DAHGDGFIARLYHNRPGTEPLVSSNAPALEARVSITETETLGSPPFALTIHATGAVAGSVGNVLVGTAGPETACPASGQYRFVLAYGGAHVERLISCRANLATNGSVSYATISPATPQPSPTPFACANPTCITMPPFPRTTVTCPPLYVQKDAATCAALRILAQQYVCDPQSPPRPYGTHIGPDADGTHDDFSNGTACGTVIAPSPSPTPPPVSSIAVLEIEFISDCDAGAAGQEFILTFPGSELTMAEVTTWVAAAAKRRARPDPLLYDPSTAVTTTVEQHHVAPSAEQCVP
ncbi:MAG: hypothetical protein M3N13_05845, partial [Candidatus Eremiobacteraeota bacterium]|nr:hypothetical protein [Candidatus Eremiobacteraeota bacterium]